jgi:enoyl-CoA hydratase/carnithine racemase
MTTPVVVDVNAHVAVVTLNRPGKHNALNMEMFEALIDAGRALAKNVSLRAVILRGAGEHFCAGIDTSIFSASATGAGLAGRMAPMADSAANFFQRAAFVWRELPVPVIAAVNGVAFGAGLQLAMGADIRIAAESARFSVMEIRWGIIPDMAISNTMRHTVRLDRLKELVYTGRIVSAPEAESMGLVTTIAADPLLTAQQLATDIAARSPHAVRAAKALLNTALDEAPAAALRREAELQVGLMGSANQAEAVRANREQREPRFDDVVE